MGKLGLDRLAMLALLAVTNMTAANPGARAAEICPQFIAKYCVVDKDHLIFSTFTNPCFAVQKGWTVLYMGACKFGKA